MIVTTSQIRERTGLSRSAVTRHLARFPGAKSGRGRYSTEDPSFAAWLTYHEELLRLDPPPEQSPSGDPQDRFRHSSPYRMLPSGIGLTWVRWDRMRGPDEDDAVRALDELIAAWRLRPHPAGPDRLPFEPMTLPSGTVVNARQWRILRGSSVSRAEQALEVLARRYGCTE